MTMQLRDLSASDLPVWALRFKLTPEQAAFVEAYRQDFDAVNACRVAGFWGRDMKALASKLLLQRNIQAALKYRNEDLHSRARETQEAILDWIRMILEADLSDIFDPQDRIRPVAEWHLVWREGLVRSVKVNSNPRKGTGIVLQIKIRDRLRFFELLMRHLGMLGPRIKRNEHKKLLVDARAAQERDDRLPPSAF